MFKVSILLEWTSILCVSLLCLLLIWAFTGVSPRYFAIIPLTVVFSSCISSYSYISSTGSKSGGFVFLFFDFFIVLRFLYISCSSWACFSSSSYCIYLFLNCLYELYWFLILVEWCWRNSDDINFGGSRPWQTFRVGKPKTSRGFASSMLKAILLCSLALFSSSTTSLWESLSGTILVDALLFTTEVSCFKNIGLSFKIVACYGPIGDYPSWKILLVWLSPAPYMECS